jgi:CRISPR-associated protein Cas5d
VIHEIGVIRRGRWFSFRRNEVKKVASVAEYGRAMADPSRFHPIEAGGGAADASQRGMLALADVAYLITAEIRLSGRAEPPRDSIEKYRAMFVSRASKGKCHHRPYLGCREFDAFFAFEPEPHNVRLCADRWPHEELGVLLYDVFDPRDRVSGRGARPCPVFFKNATVRDARLDCHPDRVELIRRARPVEAP